MEPVGFTVPDLVVPPVLPDLLLLGVVTALPRDGELVEPILNLLLVGELILSQSC